MSRCGIVSPLGVSVDEVCRTWLGVAVKGLEMVVKVTMLTFVTERCTNE